MLARQVLFSSLLLLTTPMMTTGMIHAICMTRTTPNIMKLVMMAHLLNDLAERIAAADSSWRPVW